MIRTSLRMIRAGKPENPAHRYFLRKPVQCAALVFLVRLMIVVFLWLDFHYRDK